MRHEKLEQLLLLARTLAGSAEGLTLDEMAAVASVSRSTAERMCTSLLLVFPTMEDIADGRKKRFRIPGGLDSFYNNPTVSELGALNQAAQQLERGGQGALARSLRDLERKVHAALKPPALRKIAPDLEALLQAELIAVQAGPRPIENDQLLARLREAICAMTAIEFTYHSIDKPVRMRAVAPYGIVFGRMNYLVGPEIDGDRIKTWRLDRIADLKLLKKSALRPADFHLPTFVNRSFGFYHTDPEDVVLRVLHAGMADFVNWRFHPDQTVEYQADGTAIVRFRASGMLELAWHLFSWQNKIQIIAPASLRSELQFELAKATTHHQSHALAEEDAARFGPATSKSDVSSGQD